MSIDMMTDMEGEFEDEFETEGADPFLGPIVSGLSSMFGEGEVDRDFEGEGFGELEQEIQGLIASESGFSLSPEAASVLMEVMAAQAAEAESEAEADQFLPLLAPLAAAAIPAIAKAAPGVAKMVLPKLAQGISAIGKRLWRSPARKKLMRTLPTIARGATRRVMRTVEAGKPVTGQTVVRALAGSTADVLRDPQRRRICIERSRQRAQMATQRLASAATAGR